MMRIRRLLVLPVLVAACTSVDQGDEWAGTIETLANGVVRVTNPAEGLWTGESSWRLVPELVIGDMDGEDAFVFATISGLAVDSAGRIWVLDRQANELRLFGPDGAHIRTVGRAGKGPGEYTNANGLAWLSEDTLVVIDQPGNRYSVLTSDGDFVRSVQRNLGFFGWVYSGGIEGAHVYEVFRVGDGDEARPALLGTSLRPSGPQSAGAAVAVEGEAMPALAGVADTVMLPEPAAPQYESFSVQTGRGGMVMGVPFTARPVYHLDGSGHIWHGHGGLRNLYRGTFDGDTLSEIVIGWTPLPVSQAEITEWESNESVQRFREMGGTLDMDRIPAAKPFYDDLVVESDGHAWLTVPAGPDETVFSVLDADGRYLGRLTVDGVARVPYLRPVVRHDRIYWVGIDEFDVQRVYVHRIDR